VIERCEGPDLLRAFWKAIEGVTVLDPTCGSGAFLFAALNILEPLYETCLDRMEAFVADLERSGEAHAPKKFEDFKATLAKVGAHPNARYFTLKSIILNNLFGVDIMEEAVEICKLRLFLKLAAQVDPDPKHENLGIEPLPDIDFNIRAGNTLVGYATYAEVEASATGDWIQQQELEQIKPRAADLQQAFDAFRARQVDADGSVPLEDKIELRKRLKALEEVLNLQLAKSYGLKADQPKPHQAWLGSHQPFHWFIEFYGIMNSGGFDVIVGNPPYVEFSRSKVNYQVKNFKTLPCDNLWVYSLERSVDILRESGRISLITPLSLVSTARFGPAYNLLCSHAQHATFLTLAGDAHPSVLFAGVKMSYTIFTFSKGKSYPRNAQIYMTKLYRWLAVERENLFSMLEYSQALPHSSLSIPYKVGSGMAAGIVRKLQDRSQTIAILARKRGVPLLYHRIVRHFVKALFKAPYFRNERDGEKKSDDYKVLHFEDPRTARLVRSFMLSSTYYVYFVALSDAYHCGRDLVSSFPVGIDDLR
jgi:hypothetical protein